LVFPYPQYAWKYRRFSSFSTILPLKISRGMLGLGLGIIMGQYSDRAFEFPDAAVERTALIKVEIETMTGKEA